MIGKLDEYQEDSVAPAREQVNTGTVMDTNASLFSPRHFSRFAANLNRGMYDPADNPVGTPN